MFWGLIMEPQRRYTQQVKKAFHISMAALDLSTSSDEPAQVMCGFEGRNYLLCTLKKPDMLQCPLDLNFDVGNEVSFAANGKCHVHLTGYLTDELLSTTEEEAEEEEEETEISNKNKKRIKNTAENGPPSKKTKKSSLVSSSQTENVDSDSEDSDLDVNALLEGTLPESDDDSDAIEEEEDGEEEEEEEEVDEEESSLSEEENEIELEKPKGKVNGLSKKQEKLEKENTKGNEAKKKDKKNKKAAKNKEIENENKTPNKNTQILKKRTLQGGIIVEDIKEGHGTPAKGGKFVNVYYEGRLKQNNKVFDATTKGSGFSFRLGTGEVIKGWDIGILGMKIGGKRRIICPPSMAYGQKGSPPAIPPNSTLVFEVELKKVS